MTDQTATARLHDEILEGRAEIAKLRGLLESENQRADAAIDRETTAEEAEGEHRLALSEALGLGTGAPWDAIRERAAELHRTAGPEPAADRATVLREAADRLETLDPIDAALAGQHAWRDAAVELRRLADETQQPEAGPDAYERTTGHLITCLAVAGGDSDPCCPACQVPRCDVEFVGGGRCTKPARHWMLQNQDPHTPPAVGAQQPKEARP